MSEWRDKRGGERLEGKERGIERDWMEGGTDGEKEKQEELGLRLYLVNYRPNIGDSSISLGFFHLSINTSIH